MFMYIVFTYIYVYGLNCPGVRDIHVNLLLVDWK